MSVAVAVLHVSLQQDAVTTPVETMMPIYHFSFLERTEMSEEEITPSGQVTLGPLYHGDHSDSTEHSLGQTYRVFLASLHYRIVLDKVTHQATPVAPEVSSSLY